jgi:O-6-methylguanine DNA methyltransferase
MHLLLDRYTTPIGKLLLVTDADATLRALDFAGFEERTHRLLRTHYGKYELVADKAPVALIDALDAYCDGDLVALDKVRVATGGTQFQRDVWKALRRIQPGCTTTYGQIAAELGRPQASRAVGAANGSNPIAIVVPCHRVIGSNGALTGFASGIERKGWLV